MKTYKHLTIDERSVIAFYHSEGFKVPEIAQMIGRNRATIYRELKRNSDYMGYNPAHAQEKAKNVLLIKIA